MEDEKPVFKIEIFTNKYPKSHNIIFIVLANTKDPEQKPQMSRAAILLYQKVFSQATIQYCLNKPEKDRQSSWI